MSYDFRVNPPAINWYSCDNTVGSCLGSIRVIAPGERLQQEILLQYWIRLEQPGVYEISSLGRIYQDTPNPDPDAPRERPPDVRANLTVSIHSPESPPQMSMLYRPVLENLNSKEEEKRTNAARIINEVAPPFLQPTILEMAKDPTKQYFALNGLRKLNSPESRAVLADWAAGFRNTFSSTQEIAIRYLGKMGDRSHMPLLLRLAKQSENDYLSSQALNAYAQLGRDEAIPELLRILREQPANSGKALWALARTGSRNAVPPLIEKIPVQGLSEVALASLQGLTHRRLAAPLTPETAYRKWLAWWKANGSTATIYGPAECSESETID